MARKVLPKNISLYKQFQVGFLLACSIIWVFWYSGVFYNDEKKLLVFWLFD
jgi:hypothetical protein